MTVLRSRELRSSASTPKTLRGKKKPSVSIEPSTPSQPPEPSVLHSSPLTSTRFHVSAGLGPDSGRSRRSLRLALKSSSADDSVKNGLGSVELKVDRDCGVEMDSVVRDLDDGEKAGCDFDRSIREESKFHCVEEVACGRGSCLEMEVDTGEQVCFTPENFDKRGDSGPSRHKNSQGKGKRKVNVDVTLPYLDARYENDGGKRFVSLRSGKKLLKRGLEGEAEDIDVLYDKCFDNSGDPIGEERFTNASLDHFSEMNSWEKQNYSESGNTQSRSSINEGKKKVLEIKNPQQLKIDEVGVSLKYQQDNLRANDNQRVSSIRSRQKSVVFDKGKRKLSAREKGKMIVDQNSDEGFTRMESESINIEEKESAVDLPRLHVEEGQRAIEEDEKNKLRNFLREIASRSASRFAHFDSVDEENNSSSGDSTEQEIEDWPGPFYTAMKIIKDREQSNQEAEHPVLNKSEPGSVMWVPKKTLCNCSKPSSVPSLKELCMKILAINADSISSLDCVPDPLRHRLSQLLCDSRKMTTHFFELLLRESPTEIRLNDCSWLTEEQFLKSFEGCDTSNLMVLQLDNCGRCMTDYILPSTLARYSNSLPALTTLSVSGACCLSNVGLSALVSSVPALKSLNLSQCSLLTNSSIDILANSLGSSLRELYLTDCQFLEGKHILPALKKFEQLEVLSVAGIQTISDKFLKDFVTARGHNMKGLILTDCVKLTDSSLKVIAETCSGLCMLDLVNLTKLTDSSLGHLANGCRQIHSLKLRRNAFSDESIAAYLEISGEILEELSLNNIMKVGRNTALSLAKRAKKLQSLDISWCRNLSDEAIGLIVDSCLSLRVLKLFGCTQITNVFLEGHSNPNVQIIGCKMSPVLAHCGVPDFERPVMYSS